jgi:DnaJ-class molecular chaperone
MIAYPNPFSEDYQERKEWRRRRWRRTHGSRSRTCSACSGSGYYDHDGSPPCGACAGTGKVKPTCSA